MKTIIYIILIAFLVSCEKKTEAPLKSQKQDEFNIDSIKKIQWEGRFISNKYALIKFINDSIVNIKYTSLDYSTTYLNSYNIYKITNDSLFFRYYIQTNYGKPVYSSEFDKYKYIACSDSIVLYSKKTKEAFIYYSK